MVSHQMTHWDRELKMKLITFIIYIFKCDTVLDINFSTLFINNNYDVENMYSLVATMCSWKITFCKVYDNTE